MASIPFDAAKAKENRLFNFTFGKSRETSRWTHHAQFNFEQLSSFLKKIPDIGQKDGDCYTPALFSGHTRTLQATTQIDVVVLDSDCGHTLEQIERAISNKGWRAIIHSTYSHLTDQTAIASSAYYKWRDENPGVSIEKYMMDKKSFLPNVVIGAHIVDESVEGRGGNLIVRHAPCPKFRIILPLNKPWIAAEYESQDLANAKWRARIGALAFALGLHHDQSCSDTSRLFYFPRARDAAAAAAYVCETLDGEDCDIWSLPDAALPGPAASMAALFDQYGTSQPLSPAGNVVPLLPRGSAEKKTYVDKNTGEIFDLTAWVARYGGRFEIAKAITARSPQILSPRRAGAKTHIYCVRSGEHVTGGSEGTGTYVVNASDLPQAGLPSIQSGFVIHCSHNGCANVDRLEHVRWLLLTNTLSISDLTNPEFLSEDFERVDVSAFTNKIRDGGQKEEKQKSQSYLEKIENSNISASLYRDLPGVLGAIHKYIMATSPKPQPVLALGAALALCASAVGQRVKLQGYNTRPNIYVLGVGVSGCGKDRPMSACKDIARAAGLYDELIGVEDVASDSGIVTSVVGAPRQCMLIDEASILINAINDPRAGQHLKNVVGVLLKLYSTSSNVYKGKSYADKERNQTIDQPCVSMFGASTPRGLGDALTNKDIESGLLSRVVIFDAGENDPRIGATEGISVPEEVIEWLTAWNAVKPLPNLMARIGGDAVISPRTVMLTDEAERIAKDFEGEMHEAKTKARKKGKDALYVRALENALKFALIRACSIWPVANAAGNGLMVDESALKVDAPIMRWAVDLSRATVARMDAATDDIADTPYEQNLKSLRKAIYKSGAAGMTLRDLARIPAGRVPARVLTELLATLYEAGEIKKVLKKTATGKGRPREPFVHKDFFAAVGVAADEEDDSETLMAGE